MPNADASGMWVKIQFEDGRIEQVRFLNAVPPRTVSGVTANTTAKNGQDVIADATGGNVSVAAPPLDRHGRFTVTKSDASANTVTVTGIAGGNVVLSTLGAAKAFISSGTSWVTGA